LKISAKTYTREKQQFLKNIGFKVQFLRKKAGLSQFELAEKADCCIVLHFFGVVNNAKPSFYFTPYSCYHDN